MKVSVFSKFNMLSFLEQNKLENTAVISFYNEPITAFSAPIDYTGKADRFIRVNLPDINEIGFAEHGYTADTFFSDVDKVAEFINSAYDDGLDFVCQCQFGSGRSAGCAAAILEHFEGRGNEILKSDNYNPNPVIYNKLLAALKK